MRGKGVVPDLTGFSFTEPIVCTQTCIKLNVVITTETNEAKDFCIIPYALYLCIGSILFPLPLQTKEQAAGKMLHQHCCAECMLCAAGTRHNLC